MMLLVMQSIPAERLPADGPVLPKTPSVVAALRPSNDNIVICGKTDPDQYRLRPLGPPPGGKPLPPMTASWATVRSTDVQWSTASADSARPRRRSRSSSPF